MIGILCTGEHKVLPYHYSQFIAQFIKLFVFVNSSTPYPQHIHIRFSCHIKKFFVIFRLYPGQNVISRYPIGTLCKYAFTINSKYEAFTFDVFFPYQFYHSKAYLLLFTVNLNIFILQIEFKGVQVLFSKTIWKP